RLDTSEDGTRRGSGTDDPTAGSSGRSTHSRHRSSRDHPTRSLDFVTEHRFDATEPARGVQAELETFLRRRVGDAGPIVLRCWLAGRGTTLMKFAALFEVVVEDREHAPRGAIRSVALAQLGVSDHDLDTL